MKMRFIFSTAFLGQLFLSWIPATHADGPFQLGSGRTCFDLQDFLEEGVEVTKETETLLDNLGSKIVVGMATDILLPVLNAALDTASQSESIPQFSFGIGDWKASDIDEDTCGGNFEDFGCHTIPYNVNKNYDYGIVAGLFEIDNATQAFLGFDPPEGESIFPSFCFAIKTGKDFTLGITINDGVIITMAELGPGTNPVSFLVSLLAEIGMESVTIGISAGDGLQVPVKYFNDGNWEDSDFYPSFYMSFMGGIELPFLPESFSDFIAVEGVFTRSFSISNAISTLDDIFSSSVNDLDFNFLSSTIRKLALFPEVMSITTDVAFDFTDITEGLFQSLSIGETELNVLKVPENTADFKAGIYFRAEVEATILNDIKNKICKELD
eukprot:scaffold421114_cov55-Attheya_sp.AAC.1